MMILFIQKNLWNKIGSSAPYEELIKLLLRLLWNLLKKTLNERKVLKVPAQNKYDFPPMGGDEMPPMGMENDNEEMMMGGDMEGNGDNQMPTDFDSNFDAGVEADEETDPKRFIQQLTGKLSQSLNSYNNENGEPDTELGK